MAAEFGVPQWAFGMSTYGFDARGRIVGRVSISREQLGLKQMQRIEIRVANRQRCRVPRTLAANR